MWRVCGQCRQHEKSMIGNAIDVVKMGWQGSAVSSSNQPSALGLRDT